MGSKNGPQQQLLSSALPDTETFKNYTDAHKASTVCCVDYLLTHSSVINKIMTFLRLLINDDPQSGL